MEGNSRDCRTCLNAQVLRDGHINCQLPFDENIPIVHHKQFPQTDDTGVFVLVHGAKVYFGDHCKHHIPRASKSSDETFFLEMALAASMRADAYRENGDIQMADMEYVNAKAMSENAINIVVRKYNNYGSSLNPNR